MREAGENPPTLRTTSCSTQGVSTTNGSEKFMFNQMETDSCYYVLLPSVLLRPSSRVFNFRVDLEDMEVLLNIRAASFIRYNRRC